MVRVSSYYQRVESPRWSSYLDECLQILEGNKGCPSDVFLVQLVRLQLIAESVGQAPWNEDNICVLKAPSNFYLKALQQRLREFKGQMPPELLQNSRSSPSEALIIRFRLKSSIQKCYNYRSMIQKS